MDLDPAALQRHRRCAPLYDVYPPAEWFVEAFGAASLAASLASGALLGARRLALNISLPAADGAANGVADMPALIDAELACYSAQLSSACSVDEIVVAHHAGPGAPDARLMQSVACHFDVAPAARLVLALDPATRWAGMADSLAVLRSQGFSHIDIAGHGKPSETTQTDTEATTRHDIDLARAAGFDSIGAEFVYGQPAHTSASVSAAIAALIDCAPGHIVLRSAVDVSRRFRPVLDRSRSDHATSHAIRMLIGAAQQLAAAGYECIGQDLYARPDDALAIAHRQGRLFKRPHGFSIRPVSMVLALGPGAIGAMGGSYYQNHTGIDDYRRAIEQGRFPVMRGMLLSADDLVRRTVIHALTTDLFVDIAAVEAAHRIDFRASFAAELQDLATFEQDGLVLFDAATIELTGAGRLIAGTIAMIFDRPLRESRIRTPFLARL